MRHAYNTVAAACALLLILPAVVGCSDDDGGNNTPKLDGMVAADTGGVTPDTGGVTPDTGGVTPDTGGATSDAGSGKAIVGKAGGTVTSADGKASLEIPAGLLTKDTPFSITPITNPPPAMPAPGGKILFMKAGDVTFVGPAFTFTPEYPTCSGTCNFTILIRYDPTKFPKVTPAIAEDDLRLGRWAASGGFMGTTVWSAINGSTVLKTTKQVQAKKLTMLGKLGVIRVESAPLPDTPSTPLPSAPR